MRLNKLSLAMLIAQQQPQIKGLYLPNVSLKQLQHSKTLKADKNKPA